MKCIQVRENLDAFLDGEIDFAEKEKIASHIGNCDSCKAEFESLQTIGKTIKQTLPIAAPASLDAKVFSGFENHHSEKQNVESSETQAKIGWFGIPKFAFAGGLILLALFSGMAFQLGRMSASDVQVSSPQNVEIDPDENTFAKNKNLQKMDDSKTVETKFIEVPVIKEKIVKVPVIKEKILTRTVYIDRKQKVNKPNLSGKEDLALNNSVKDGEFLTQTNLKDFQPVAEIKPKISKEKE